MLPQQLNIINNCIRIQFYQINCSWHNVKRWHLCGNMHIQISVENIQTTNIKFSCVVQMQFTLNELINILESFINSLQIVILFAVHTAFCNIMEYTLMHQFKQSAYVNASTVHSHTHSHTHTKDKVGIEIAWKDSFDNFIRVCYWYFLFPLYAIPQWV